MKKYPDHIAAFGRVVKKLRKEKSYSQQELADDCDIERKSLTKIENGKMAASLHMIILLAESLETTPQNLFDMMYVEVNHMQQQPN